MRQGRKADAIAEWKTARASSNPRLFDALYNLGTVLYNAGRRDEARPYLERFVNEAPRGRYAPTSRSSAAPEPLTIAVYGEQEITSVFFLKERAVTS